jgi:hypothetical protein
MATVTNNTSDSDRNGTGNGGGFYNSASLTLGGSIVAENIDTGDEDDDCSGPASSFGYNLIGLGVSTTCSYTPGTNDLVGVGTPVDPFLSTLADHGGPTLTHALLKSSPAIDHIDLAGIGCSTGQRTDQRGVIRFSPCDIGAYEIDIAEHIYLPLVIK